MEGEPHSRQAKLFKMLIIKKLLQFKGTSPLRGDEKRLQIPVNLSRLIFSGRLINNLTSKNYANVMN